jgi:anti-sigma factor RsiW
VPFPDRPQDETRLIDFLLGRLPRSERESIEQECLDDAAARERLEAIESELIEDYLDGRLDPEDRRSFEQRYLRHPERRHKVDLVAALNRRFQRPERRRTPQGLTRFGLAAVLLVLVSVSAAYYVLRPAPPFVLRPGGVTRSLQASEQVISPWRAATSVQIRLDLTGMGRGAAIDRAELRTVEEETPVWIERIHPPSNQGFLDLVLQKSILEDRDYILTLDAGSTPVLSYPFRIHQRE